MQGKKTYQEKLFTDFRLSDRIPRDNFHRRLKDALDLEFPYPLAKGFHGRSGQKGIDPVVFPKLCLVGYLENIISDRRPIAHCSMRMDILFFPGYDMDEGLPWHSTVGRTRQLFPGPVFEEESTEDFGMSVEKGLVSGHTQVTDSAPVKANAGQKKITANKQGLRAITGRNKKWARDQDRRPGAGNKGSKYTSNKTHYSPVDPDARIGAKPGKARKPNHRPQLTVGAAHHVITDIGACHADGKDNQHLPDIVERVRRRLWQQGPVWENYALLERQGLKSFIPPHGTYKGGPDGLTYDGRADHYVCPQGKAVPFTKEFNDHRTGTKKKEYRAGKKPCLDCPIRSQCLGKGAQEKKFGVTCYRAEYERNNRRINSPQGKHPKAKRQSTVEPVLGTLTQFMGLRKVNTMGLRQANKCMQMAAIAYNLKKYLKFIENRVKSGASALILQKLAKSVSKKVFPAFLGRPKIYRSPTA